MDKFKELFGIDIPKDVFDVVALQKSTTSLKMINQVLNRLANYWMKTPIVLWRALLVIARD